MSWWAEVALLVIAAANFLGLVVLTVFAVGAYRQLRALNEKARTVLSQAEGALDSIRGTAVVASERAEKVSGEVTRRAERIAELSEQVAKRVAQRVDATSSIVQEAISSPVVNLASVRAGVSKGLEVWQELTKARGGNGK